MISILPGFSVTGVSVVGVVGVNLAGVVTLGTSTAGLPGSVILPVPGTLPSGNSLFGTLPLPSSPIVTVIGLPSLPGISTLVPGGYVEPSGFLGVTVTSPVSGSRSHLVLVSYELVLLHPLVVMVSYSVLLLFLYLGHLS